MNLGELISSWRSHVVDVAKPYLWSDDEARQYANDAYRMFFRLTGGISDFLSDACSVDIVAGEPLAELHPSVLRVMSATRNSDTGTIEVINSTDIGKLRSSDYGQMKTLVMDNKAGPVRYMVQGMKKGYVRWVQVPEVDDTALLHVYRLPLVTLTNDEDELDELDEYHHIHLFKYMDHLAYMKQDAETFNKTRSDEGLASFKEYCAFVKSEWERYKHKTRVVEYGGL